MKIFRSLSVACVCLLATACLSAQRKGPSAPPIDPIAQVPGATLRAEGLGYAQRGDLIRSQQYLSAALQKGFDETIVIPELVKVCVASSRLRAALEFAQPYLRRHPRDAGMQNVVATIHRALGDVAVTSGNFENVLESKKVRPTRTAMEEGQ